MRRFALVISMLAAVGFALPAAADTTITGEKKGAFFKITVPTGWNGNLVIYNHGYDFDFDASPSLGPIAPLWLSQGYAVAASGHSMSGWVLFNSKRDTERMVDVFTAEFGAPADVYVAGFSLGGIVTAQLVEKLQGVNIVGAYPLCGALAGSRLWDGGIDLRLIYDEICGGVAPIPGSATGLPSPGHPSFPWSQFATALSTNACMGVPFGGAGDPVNEAIRRAQFAAVTQLPESAISGDVQFAVHGVSNVVHEPAKLDGENGMSNIGVTYPDAGINASIQRVTPDNQARKRLQRYFTPKGDVGATKIVSIHTDGDGLIIVENESEYQSVVPASNLTVGIVNEAGNTHCGFTEAEITGGWLALEGWVAGLPQPSASDLQDTCLFAQFVLGAGGPCRIDPGFVIPDMDGRIPPR